MALGFDYSFQISDPVQLIIDPRPGFGAASASATNITIGQNGKMLVREGVQHELLTGIDRGERRLRQ
jgi:hypothetical protein